VECRARRQSLEKKGITGPPREALISTSHVEEQTHTPASKVPDICFARNVGKPKACQEP